MDHLVCFILFNKTYNLYYGTTQFIGFNNPRLPVRGEALARAGWYVGLSAGQGPVVSRRVLAVSR